MIRNGGHSLRLASGWRGEAIAIANSQSQNLKGIRVPACPMTRSPQAASSRARRGAAAAALRGSSSSHYSPRLLIAAVRLSDCLWLSRAPGLHELESHRSQVKLRRHGGEGAGMTVALVLGAAGLLTVARG
eukprot:167572-Rhodomonas_salina.2